MKQNRKLIHIAGFSLGLLALMNAGHAEGKLGEILPDDIAAKADASALVAEAQVFNTIKKGVTLSLAMCTGVEKCKPTVNRAELEHIITTLKTRIDNITQRYEQSKDSDLEGLLISYADARDSYTKDLDKLGTIVPEEPVETTNIFGAGLGGNAGAEYSIFNDADTDLQDDDDTGDDNNGDAGDDNNGDAGDDNNGDAGKPAGDVKE